MRQEEAVGHPARLLVNFEPSLPFPGAQKGNGSERGERSKPLRRLGRRRPRRRGGTKDAVCEHAMVQGACQHLLGTKLLGYELCLDCVISVLK